MNSDQQQYHDEMETRLKACSSRIDSLKATAQGAPPREKLKLYNQLEDLLIREKGVRVELHSLKRASAEGWRKHQSGTEKAMQSLREALDAIA